MDETILSRSGMATAITVFPRLVPEPSDRILSMTNRNFVFATARVVSITAPKSTHHAKKRSEVTNSASGPDLKVPHPDSDAMRL